MEGIKDSRSELTHLSSEEYFGQLKHLLDTLHADMRTLENYRMRAQRVSYFKNLLVEAVEKGSAHWSADNYGDPYAPTDPDFGNKSNLTPQEIVVKIQQLDPSPPELQHTAATLISDRADFPRLRFVIDNINHFGEGYGMKFHISPTMSYQEIESAIDQAHDAKMYQVQRGNTE